MMTRMRIMTRLLGLGAILVASTSCGQVVRNGSSPVYIVIDQLLAAQGNKTGQLTGNLTSDVITNITSPPPCTTNAPCPTVFNDVGSAKLRISPKDIGSGATATTPTLNNEVTITRYHVSYRRADGRNTPGVDVPYGFDGAVTGTIPASGSLTLGFELVRYLAKTESPLVQLVSSGNMISTIADVTFYGTDQTGNVLSVTGSILIDFANFGDT